jgi:hypothetical protein
MVVGGNHTGKTPASNMLFPVVTAFSVACATLMLQVVETRIYSVVFWNHLVYLIVSVALLGFGISGTWLAFGKETWLARRLTLPVAAIGFAVTAVLSALIVPQWGVNIDTLFVSAWHTIRLLVTYSTAIFPYFFAGWILGTIYREYAGQIHFLYFADLIGAASGCLAVPLLIRPAGAIVLVALACALGALPILIGDLLARRNAPSLALLTGAVAALALVAHYADAINLRIVPDRAKNFSVFSNDPRGQRKHELSEWNILARTDVIGAVDTGEKRIYIDGAAFTRMATEATRDVPPFDKEREPLVPFRAPYVLPRKCDRTLVIGSGGGLDVWHALRGGAKHVDAVEINPTTARIVKNEYNDVLSGLFTRPEVNLMMAEGRSFVRSRSERYDLIVMHAIDTFAAIDAGAYMLAENYLYTVDAIVDYMQHLEPEGILSITRWCYAGETPRLFSIMLEALYELGYQNPESHLALEVCNSWTAALASPTPFSPDELALLKAHTGKYGGAALFPLSPEEQVEPVQKIVNEYAQARKHGTQNALCAAYTYNIKPVWDDDPFFFHYEKMSSIVRILDERTSWDFIRGQWPSLILFLLLLLMSLALALFVILPLWRRGRGDLPGFGLWLVYFCCLGVAFIFVEICFMQRFALLLGHPGRSLVLVLGGLLFFAGLGSNLKPKLNIRLERTLLALCAVIIVSAFGYPHIVRAILGWPLWMRSVATVLLVAPAAIFMGMPFPTGLRAVAARSADAVPWMWGVNGGATVLGSILAIIVAIYFSFTTVLVIAAMGYAAAGILYRSLQKG